MDRENTFTMEQIMFDVCLGIDNLVKIRFLSNNEMKRYADILEEKYKVKNLMKNLCYDSIHIDLARASVITNNKGVLENMYTIMDVKYIDYIQINDDTFIET